MPDVLVIGGGAAGLMAAYAAASYGARVRILEHNEKAGKKIYITGKGRCNLTNDCTRDEFMREVARNPRFLYSALSALSPQDMMSLMEENGLPLVTERGRRVFPASYHASDVTKTLEKMLRRLDVEILFHTQASHLLTEDGHISGVETADGHRLSADRVILATGGLSYPSTGSTGDGFRMACETGHTLQPLFPSLVGVDTREAWPKELQGLSLKNVRLCAKQGKKVIYDELGEMLFTHFGISGPLVLEMSCHLPDRPEEAALSLNLKPGLTPEQLTARLQRDFDAQPRRRLRSMLEGLLPQRFAALFPECIGLDGEKTCANISRQEREMLRASLQQLPLHILSRRPFSEAIVTRGGITVKEVSSQTMESRILPGLYLCGEVLDVDAHTGGYNLQIAFSTGYLAGMSAAQSD